MHRVARATRGLQTVAVADAIVVRPGLRPQSLSISTSWTIRRSSYISPDNFLKQALGDDAATPSERKKPRNEARERGTSASASKKSRRGGNRPTEGHGNGLDLGVLLPKTMQVGGTPSQVSNEPGLKDSQSPAATGQASTTVPLRKNEMDRPLVRRYRVHEAPAKKEAPKPRVVEFGGLPEGATLHHVIHAIRDAVEDNRISRRTARVLDAKLLGPRTAQVEFYWPAAALETYHLVGAGGLRIVGPRGAGVVPTAALRRSSGPPDLHASGARTAVFGPDQYREFLGHAVEKEKLVRRTHLLYNRTLPLPAGGNSPTPADSLAGVDDWEAHPERRGEESTESSEQPGREGQSLEEK